MDCHNHQPEEQCKLCDKLIKFEEQFENFQISHLAQSCSNTEADVNMSYEEESYTAEAMVAHNVQMLSYASLASANQHMNTQGYENFRQHNAHRR
jgi:hypothetical protein